MTNDKLEAERLRALLISRNEEYAVFGCTSEDRERDAQIRAKIEELDPTAH